MSWLRDSVHSFTLPPPDNTACVTQFKETNYTLKEKSPGLKYTVSLIIDESEMLALARALLTWRSCCIAVEDLLKFKYSFVRFTNI